MANKEKTFDVLVTRVSYSSRTIQVKASSKEEAGSKALDEAGDHIFNENDTNYKVNYVTEVK